MQHDPSVPGTEPVDHHWNLLERAFPGHAGDQDTIVWRVGPEGVRAPQVRTRITAMLDKVAAAPSVAAVISPYSARGAAQVSRDGTIAYATVVFDAQAASLPGPDISHVIRLAEAARAPGLQVDLGGQAVENALRQSIGTSAVVGLVAAAVVLFIAFGSLLAMLLPLAVAIAGLASGLMTVGLASHAVSIASIGPTLATLIGLGVGVDYALFVVTRHRSKIKAGMFPAALGASVASLNSAGRAIHNEHRCVERRRCASPSSGCSAWTSAPMPGADIAAADHHAVHDVQHRCPAARTFEDSSGCRA